MVTFDDTSPGYFKVSVRVLEAKELPSLNVTSFACVQVGNEIRTTATFSHTGSPKFDEFFVFDVNDTISNLFDRAVTISLFEPKKAFKRKKIIGLISMDLLTVWIQPENKLQKWFALTLPSDRAGLVKGFVKCEVSVEAQEKGHNLVQMVPMENVDVLGNQRARYTVRLYHCVGLNTQEDDKKAKDVFITVSFAGTIGRSTNRVIRESPQWDEEIIFIESFPPLFQRVTVKIHVGNSVIASRTFHLFELSVLNRDSYITTYGPTYVHFYENDFTYSASMFMSIDTEVIKVLKPNEQFQQVSVKPTRSVSTSEYGTKDGFLCYAVLFDVVLTDRKLMQDNISLLLNWGSVGRRISRSAENCTTTGKYSSFPGDSQYVYLPFQEDKPCLFVKSEWLNTQYRLYNSNMLSKLADELKRRVDYAHDLVSRGSYSIALDILKASNEIVRSESKMIAHQLLKGHTTLDAGRIKYISNQLTLMTSKGSEELDTISFLANLDKFLLFLNAVCEDPQDSLPGIILQLKKNDFFIGYCKINARDIINSKMEASKGKSAGNIVSFVIKKPDGGIIGRADVWLWLGLWNHMSHCLKNLPPGHEDISKALTLPTTLKYQVKQPYIAVCHIFEGCIEERSINSLFDTYVRVLITHESRQTNLQKKTLTPVWKETLFFKKLMLYPSPSYIQEYPPTLTVELWNQSSKPPSLIGSSFVSPRVRLNVTSAEAEYDLQWISLSKTSQVLCFFEIISTDESISNKLILKKLIPQFSNPKTISYRMEIVFWGIREFDINVFKDVKRSQAIVQCGEVEVRSGVLLRPNMFHNFDHVVEKVEIKLPEIKFYTLPLVVHILKETSYIGYAIDRNIHRYEYKLPTKYQWTSLTTQRKSVVSRAKARHSSFRDTVSDLTPLIEINSNEHLTDLESGRRCIPTRLMRIWRTIKEFFTSSKLKRISTHIFFSVIDENEYDEDDEYDWWYKYASGHIKIFYNELEDQPEFNSFSDVFRTFEVKGVKEGKEVKLKLKAMLCIYRWPVDTHVVNFQGHDPENGVLQLSEVNERIKLLVRVYCIKATDLHPSDLNNKADPYIELKTSSDSVSDSNNYISKQLNPVFGKCLEITAVFPTDTLLSVRVMDWDRVSGDDVIGETIIDLENRFYTKHRASCGISGSYCITGYDAWRDVEKPSEILEKLCHTHNISLPLYYEKSVLVASREFILQKRSKNNEENMERLALKALHHWHEIPVIGRVLVPEHVETRSLFHKDRPGVEQGKIEMWVDIFDTSLGVPPPPVDITPQQPQRYELRVIIWNTCKVPLVDSPFIVGKRHVDIFVKGWLWDPKSVQSTDVHHSSFNGNGQFNWRFVFPFLYLRSEKKMVIYQRDFFDITKSEHKVQPLLKLQVWDKDRIGADDFIGSIELDLSRMPRGAKSTRNYRLKQAARLDSVDLFKIKHMRGWWPFQPASSGCVEAELQLLTADEALEHPAGLGRSEPEALPEPLRPEIKMRFWLLPFRALASVLCLMCKVHKVTCILAILTFATVIFVLVAIYSIPMFLIKKLLGA